jgi:hypothetical protein
MRKDHHLLRAPEAPQTYLLRPTHRKFKLLIRKWGRGTSGRPISEQLLALQSHEMVEHGNVKVSFFKDEFA